MANIDSFAFEYVQVDIDQVEPHPFGEPVTPETMQRDLQKIGSLESWTSKYGEMFKHCPHLIQRVGLLVTTGVANWNFPGGWEDMSEMFPTATRATLWILLHTEHDGDDERLYSKLTETARTNLSWVKHPANATICLEQIVEEMTQEGMSRMRAQLELLPAGRMAASSLVSDS
jgi:hypothetical protein